jgi:hypothetical protein
MMTDYRNIVAGLPIMYLIVVVAMCVVIGAMCMDAAFGWRKAKLGDGPSRIQSNLPIIVAY